MTSLRIIFSGPEVTATLAGRKTVFRRPIKQAVDKFGERAWAFCPARESGYIAWFGKPMEGVEEFTKRVYRHGFKPPYQPGDLLIVKWREVRTMAEARRESAPHSCRLTLEVVSVRPERLQEITEADCQAEGITGDEALVGQIENPWRTAYADWWDMLQPKHPWEQNPWVWRVEYAVKERR